MLFDNLMKDVPFSFVYDGKPSGTFLSEWPRTMDKKEDTDQPRQIIEWNDPDDRLKVIAEVTAFRDFQAAEWVLRFENIGDKDTSIIEQVRALDFTLDTTPASAVVLDGINGDDCTQYSFLPFLQELAPGGTETFACVGGRSSNGDFPFFNVRHDDHNLFVAIGWTGQWSATISRAEAGADGVTRVTAGMGFTRLRLHPGESIRTPRILLMRTDGDRMDAHNLFRRLMLAHYIPKTDGKTWCPAIAAQGFNMNHTGKLRPEWNTEAGQIAAAKIAKEIGCDTHWLDASWFEGGFPNGVGNWTVRAKEYPNGLGPIRDACRELGLKFLVWWEPERVVAGTKIDRKHHKFLIHHPNRDETWQLYNLGDPDARRYLTDLLLHQIDEFGVDTYRNDFNMDPLVFWWENDTDDRRGMTEIRYVEGFYQMWDEIRAKRPDIMMDNCASGGRRIDLEMCSRAIPQTRSDTGCVPGRSDWDQSQTYGLSLFLPVHATLGWSTAPYDCRSSATAGFLAEWDILDPAFPIEEAKASIAEIKENQPFWNGDFYPLIPCSINADQWIAWQLHDPDREEGIVLAFRRVQNQEATLRVQLRALSPDSVYETAWLDEERKMSTRQLAGTELANTEIHLKKPRTSMLIRYKKNQE